MTKLLPGQGRLNACQSSGESSLLAIVSRLDLYRTVLRATCQLSAFLCLCSTVSVLFLRSPKKISRLWLSGIKAA